MILTVNIQLLFDEKQGVWRASCPELNTGLGSHTDERKAWAQAKWWLRYCIGELFNVEQFDIYNRQTYNSDEQI